MPATPESVHVMPARQSLLTSCGPPKFSQRNIFWGGYSTQAPADAQLGPGLIASVMDPPLMSVRAAGIPRASALAVTETVPLTSALPVMAVAILCVWAAHCTPEACPVHEYASETSPVHKSSPEASPRVCSSASRGGGVHCRTSRGRGNYS